MLKVKVNKINGDTDYFEDVSELGEGINNYFRLVSAGVTHLLNSTLIDTLEVVELEEPDDK